LGTACKASAATICSGLCPLMAATIFFNQDISLSPLNNFLGGLMEILGPVF
jgi:hypothetical protein